MIGIIVATHGEFASGLIDGMTLLCGEQEKIIPFGLRIEAVSYTHLRAHET